MTHPHPVGPSPVAAAPGAGWYADPTGVASLRWWDGRAWTTHVHQPPLPAPAPRASFGARAQGYLIDALLLWPVSLLLFQGLHQRMYDELLGVLVSSALTQGGQLPGLDVLWTYGLVQLWAVTALPGALLRVLYDVVCLTRWGGTWGQRRVGVVVRPGTRPATGEHAPLPWPAALVRSLVIRLAAPTVMGWLLVVLWSLVDRDGRSLADVAAGTVVDAQRPDWLAPRWRGAGR